MPPRHAYWTILIDDQPTAFRAHDAEELLPTLNRLREKNPSAVMKWFERGKLFDSRDQAREAGLGQGERRWEGPRPDRHEEGPRRNQAQAPRDKNWRPGGEHRDPRQKYKDAKKAKWNRFKDKIRQRHDERGSRDSESFTPPHGDKLRQPDRRANSARPSSDRRPAWRDEREERGELSRDRRPAASWGHGPAAKPHGDKLSARPRRPEWRRDDNRRDDDRHGGQREGDRHPRPWSDRPPRRESDRTERAWSDRPPQRQADRDQRPWRDRPPRRENDRDSRPWNDRPPRPDTRSGGTSRTRQDSGGWKPRGPDARRAPAGGANRQSWAGKPAASGERKPWAAKPPGGRKKSWSPKPSGRRPDGGGPPKRRRDDE